MNSSLDDQIVAWALFVIYLTPIVLFCAGVQQISVWYWSRKTTEERRRK